MILNVKHEFLLSSFDLLDNRVISIDGTLFISRWCNTTNGRVESLTYSVSKNNLVKYLTGKVTEYELIYLADFIYLTQKTNIKTELKIVDRINFAGFIETYNTAINEFKHYYDKLTYGESESINKFLHENPSF